MTRSASTPTRAGFTLMELLMVIGIITILIVLSIAVALKVTGTGKKASTEQTLRALDTALNAYMQSKGAAPPAWVLDPRSNGGSPNTTYIQPVADARNMAGGQEMINSVGLFVLQCKDVPAAEAAIKDLDAKLLRQYNPESVESTSFADHQPTLTTAFDGWGNPIRYVHPQFKGLLLANPSDPTSGVQTVAILPEPPGLQFAITGIRRNGGGTTPSDSDGGLGATNRPYFYSCGPDGDPSTTEDNVYLTAPRFQKAP